MAKKTEKLKEAEYIWNRLDDLANNDPVAYQEFIKDQMEERKIFFSKPEPKLAISTKLANKPDQVFVNICGWKKMPCPENDKEPIKLMAGFKQSIELKSGAKQHIFPVAVNDKILEECTLNKSDEKLMLNLILELLENQFKIKICRTPKKCKLKFVGEKYEDMRKHFQKNVDKSPEELFDKSELINSPKDVLKHIIDDKENEEKSNVDPIEINIEKVIPNGQNKSKNPLISVIENEEISTVPEPMYNILETTNPENKPIYDIKIQLPSVTSVAECDLCVIDQSSHVHLQPTDGQDLSVGMNEIELTVQEKFYLKLPLKKNINTETTKAKFVRKKQTLSLRMEIL